MRNHAVLIATLKVTAFTLKLAHMMSKFLKKLEGKGGERGWGWGGLMKRKKEAEVVVNSVFFR